MSHENARDPGRTNAAVTIHDTLTDTMYTTDTNPEDSA